MPALELKGGFVFYPGHWRALSYMLRSEVLLSSSDNHGKSDMRELAQLECLLNQTPAWWNGDQHLTWHFERGLRFDIIEPVISPHWRITWGRDNVETSPLVFGSIKAAKADLRRRLEIRAKYLLEAEAVSS